MVIIGGDLNVKVKDMKVSRMGMDMAYEIQKVSNFWKWGLH